MSAAPFSPFSIGNWFTVQIEILTLYLTILFFNNWNLTGSNSDSGPGKSRGVLSPGACWLASLGVVSTGGGEEAVRRPNKSFQSKTTMLGSPPLTHKPLGQVQGPKGPALAPKQSQAQKWCEPDVQIWSRSASRMVIRMPLISSTVELLVQFFKILTPSFGSEHSV